MHEFARISQAIIHSVFKSKKLSALSDNIICILKFFGYNLQKLLRSCLKNR